MTAALLRAGAERQQRRAVITGNGHCPEHACLWQEELKLFISGDQVLPRISSGQWYRNASGQWVQR